MSFMHMGAVTAASGVSSEPDPLSVNVSPSSINEAQTGCPIVSSLLTATGSGGAGGFTFAWDFKAGGAGLTINSPSSQSTTVTQNGAGIKSGTLRCTVTDADTDTATDVASITLECGT